MVGEKVMTVEKLVEILKNMDGRYHVYIDYLFDREEREIPTELKTIKISTDTQKIIFSIE